MSSISPRGDENSSTTTRPLEDTRVFIKVRTQALTINHALNTRDFGLLASCLSDKFVGYWAFFPDTPLDKASFVESIRKNADEHPNWQCKAVDIYLHGKGKSSEGQPEWVNVMVDCQQSGEPDGILRKTFMLLEFRRPGRDTQAVDKKFEWLCTNLKATQGLVAGDAWFI